MKLRGAAFDLDRGRGAYGLSGVTCSVRGLNVEILAGKTCANLCTKWQGTKSISAWYGNEAVQDASEWNLQV